MKTSPPLPPFFSLLAAAIGLFLYPIFSPFVHDNPKVGVITFGLICLIGGSTASLGWIRSFKAGTMATMLPIPVLLAFIIHELTLSRIAGVSPLWRPTHEFLGVIWIAAIMVALLELCKSRHRKPSSA